jgi:hypothetical protein
MDHLQWVLWNDMYKIHGGQWIFQGQKERTWLRRDFVYALFGSAGFTGRYLRLPIGNSFRLHLDVETQAV